MTVTIESINERIDVVIQNVKSYSDFSPEVKKDFDHKVQKNESETTKQLIELIESLENKPNVKALIESENVDFNQVIDDIEDSKGHEKEKALEFLREIEERIPPEDKKLIENTIEVNKFSSARFLIEKAPPSNLTSSSNIEIPVFRNAIARKERIAEIKTLLLLQEPQNNFEENVRLTTDKNFEANVKWVAEKGFQRELHLIDEILANVSFFQKLTYLRQALLTIAKVKIRKRLNNSIKFRIFCSREELLGLSVISNNFSEIYIVDEYPGFVMVSFSNSLSDNVVAEVRKSYTVEVWGNVKVSDSDIDQQNDTYRETEQMNRKNQIIQFNAPMRQNWGDILKNAGVKILQPLSYTQLIVSVPNEQALEEIKKFEYVANVQPFQPSIRVKLEELESLGQEITDEVLQELLLKEKPNDGSLEQDSLTEPGILVAEFLTKDYRDLAERHFHEVGILILNSPSETKLILDLSSGKNIREYFRIITEQPGLESVAEKPIPKLFNYHSISSIRKVFSSNICINDIDPSDFSSIYGEGEIIAIADTGLDSGTKVTQHPDFHNQILEIRSYPLPPSYNSNVCNPGSDDGCADFHTGHGTHVAGTVLGNGRRAEDFGLSITPKGIAPKAKLFFQAIEQTAHWTQAAQNNYLLRRYRFRDSIGFWGIPDSLKQLFQDAFDIGARIHSNSWGCDNFGEYDSFCKDVDQFVWENKDFLIVTAAGNDGLDGASSVTPLGTAKNCLTVGASSSNSVANFSSCGPCNDGRLKPDIIAPGTTILSTRSTQLSPSNFPYNNYLPVNKNSYMYMDGTSMATPLVAGCAALLRHFLRSPERKTDCILKPSAALLKAALIHSAEYLFYKDHKGPWFDYDQGWGRINLSSILAPNEPIKIFFRDVDQNDGVNSEKCHTYKFKVTDSSNRLRVTLAYTDQPIVLGNYSNEYLSEVLISNLNLELVNSNNRRYCGNDQDDTGKPDKVNNVEGVIITTPDVGEWHIKIIAATPLINQDYALVISGCLCDLERIF